MKITVRANSAQLTHKRVLIVDDDQSILDYYKMLLENWGFDVYTASNTEESLSIMAQQHIDLAIIDLHLVGETGLNVAESMNRNEDFRKTPKMAMSSTLPRGLPKDLFKSFFNKSWSGNGLLGQLSKAIH